ncbi:MAG: zinc ABC transporter substrate-binding protein [Oscillospiraceae bacterium]|nr:zinc ABC transporter substrate-binding protein [Oscillospiraceae bacterium]
MKRLLALIMALFVLSSCAAAADKTETAKADSEARISVVATIFPQYDFARQIAGGRASVKLLLPAGMESHSYEPTPSDIVAINKCDVFLYTGAEMEPWTQTLLDGGLESDTLVVDLSQGIAMSETESVTPDDGHEHEEESHHHVVDPHIWTSPVNAMAMVKAVCDAFCERDPDGESIYRENLDKYLKELESLDNDIRSIVENGNRKEIVFGSRYAFHYFSEEYGLTCYAAYDSCSEENEASAGAVAGIIDLVNEKNIPVIYHEEMIDPKVARAIADETGAELLMMHSAHNLSKDEMASGETYLSIMRKNAENLRKGLN